jgi:hypothetical protein
MNRQTLTSLVWCAATLLAASPAQAHSGPPFPIVSDRRAGPFTISIWTDPDTTDDGSRGGQFWIVLGAGDGKVPTGTRATVSATPLDRPGATRSADAMLQRDDAATYYADLVLDHEGRFRVHVSIDSPLGMTAVDSDVMATYDLRPSLAAVLLSVAPFVLVGLLWAKLLIRRRRALSNHAPLSPRARRGRATTTQP